MKKCLLFFGFMFLLTNVYAKNMGSINVKGVATFEKNVAIGTTTAPTTELYVLGNSTVTDRMTAGTFDSGQGPGEFYGGDQYVTTKSTPTFPSINTGGRHWELIYSTDILTNCTTFYITGLNGNVDINYRFIYRIIGGAAGTALHYMSINNDTNTNYGYNNIYAIGGGAPASEVSTIAQGLICGVSDAAGHISMLDSVMFAKSGYGRVLTGSMPNRIVPATKTVGLIYHTSSVWSNTADNITSITVWASVSNAIGVGSHFEIWRKR